jgi:hypothetical protein
MMATRDLAATGAAPPPLIREAVLSGLVGAAVVALCFLVLDVAKGQLLFTPAALGSALFLGARGIAEVQITPLTVLGYTIVHVAAFVLIALLLVALIRSVAHHPPAILGAALLLITMEVFAIGMLAILASWLLDALSIWTVLIANVLAGTAMGVFLWTRNPLLQAGLRADLEERQ